MNPLATSALATLKITKYLHICTPCLHQSPWLTQIPQQLARSCCFFSSPATPDTSHSSSSSVSKPHSHAHLPAPPFLISTVYVIFIFILILDFSRSLTSLPPSRPTVFPPTTARVILSGLKSELFRWLTISPRRKQHVLVTAISSV